MSVPFSNTHLRVPRGFGTILEGLAREVLRDQPEDIPKYAAHYFDALLKQRDEIGIDPAEWAAKLEDRFYNNHAFRASKPSPEKEPSAKMTFSKEKSYESQTEDESNHTEDSNVSTTHPTLSEEVDLSESMEEYEEKQGITEKHVVSIEEGLSEEESVNMLPAADLQPDDLSGTEEERDQTITTFDQVDRAANGKDSFSVADQDNAQSELEPTDLLSLKAISNVDGCAQELKLENECGDDEPKTSFVDMEIVDSEGDENNDGEEAVEVLSYPGLADVDVCATELGGTERSMEGANAENDEDSSKSQPEEKTVQSVLSQSETPEHNQQEEEDQVEKTEEEGSSSESFSDVIHERLTHIEADLVCNDMPNEDSLVEINFEDVPEGQQIKEVEEKQPEEDSSVDVLQTRFLEMQQEEECKTAVETESNISHKQDHDEPAMMGVEKEVKSEGEEMERDHKKSDIMNKNVDTNDSHLNNSDIDGNREGVKTIGSSHQPTIDEANSEDEMDHKNEGNNKEGEINRNEFHQNEGWEKDEKSNNAEDETTDTVGGNKEDTLTEGNRDVEIQETNAGGAKNQSSQVTLENISTAATEAKGETLEASTNLPEENEESRRTHVDSQLQDTVGETEVTSTEKGPDDVGQLEGEVDSEMQERSDTLCEDGGISPTPSADQPAAEEEEPLASEKDSTDPEGKSSDKEDCSRPQEEEDIMDIPLDDPEANRAAAKIQAGFRGHMTRKKMKPEDKVEGEEVSSTGDVLNCSQGDTETGGSGAVERDDTSVPEQ